MRERRHRLNTPEVITETVNGEAIVIHLGTGTYYSITGDAVRIWSAMVDGATVDEIGEVVGGVTGADVAAATAAVGRFRDGLTAEGLIVDRDDAASAAPEIDLSGGGSGLLEPAFEAYTDMRDIVLLDPVHEVGEQGWPHVQPAG